MNTDPKKNQRVQGLQLHPEQTSPNTNPRRLYAVTLILKQEHAGILLVPAKSRDHAARKAQMLALHRVKNWELFAQILTVESVQGYQEDQNHD